MSVQSVAMQQALEQLRSMRESVQASSAGLTIKPSDLAQGKSGVEGATFTQSLKNAIDQVNSQQQAAKDLQVAYVNGEDVSLTDVMLAMQKSSIAFEATVQVRNKILESYREIMSMTV